MTEQPVDLTMPQPPVTSEARGQRRTPREWGFRQLLDRIATTATERAAATADAEEKPKLERVAQLAHDLSEALSAVEVTREPRGPQPT
jgi:hypothetical protein